MSQLKLIFDPFWDKSIAKVGLVQIKNGFKKGQVLANPQIREKFIPEQISQFGFVVFTIVISIFAALNPYIEFKKAP